MPGVVAGALIFILSVSLAALVFSGPLASYLSVGIAMAINAAVVVGLIFSAFSGCQPILAQVDEDTAPIIALMVTLVATSLPATASDAQVFASVIVAIMFATAVTGAGLALLGTLKAGGFVQYLPHSVMGGYFAALGWLLLTGGFALSAPNSPIGYTTADQLLQTTSLASWLPAVIVTASLIMLARRVSRTRLLVATVALSCAAWFAAALAYGHGPDSLLQSGLLIGPLQETGLPLWDLLRDLDVAATDWPAVFMNAGSIATVLLISLISLLFCVSGLGHLYRGDPDMNRELRIAGLANIGNGLTGGMLGLPTYNLSSQAHDMGAAGNRWAGVVAVATCLSIFVFGFSLVAYTPRFVISGLLMFLGLNLMREWLLDGLKKFSSYEYLVIPIILVSAVFLGFLEGILIGLIAAIVLFVVKYSRTRVIRFSASSVDLGSNVERNVFAQRHIRQEGARIFILGLQGYLFFGTAGRVLAALKQRLADRSLPPPQAVILDFSQVTGVDASAAINFQKMERLAAQQNFVLVLAKLGDGLRQRLQSGGFGSEHPASLMFVDDLDRALEHAENALLNDSGEAHVFAGCFEQLRHFFDSDEDLETFKTYLERREVAAGTTLTEQGDDTSELFLVETCSVSAYIRQPDGRMLRVRSTEHGTVYGELGFYLGTPRSASVITDEPGVVYVLSAESAEKLDQEHPTIASDLHRYLANVLSERLLFTTQSLKAVTF
ncbi:MAG: SulP family inorganic anion transporter [Woeseiaceae bacterium]|nr:SulP family inorganic anion transporter [Woeseiaceae bacterium]